MHAKQARPAVSQEIKEIVVNGSLCRAASVGGLFHFADQAGLNLISSISPGE